MNRTQYRITPSGRKALVEGDYLIHLADAVAKDGILTSKEIMDYHLGLTKIEANTIISVLKRLGFIEEAPIQGVGYAERGKYN